ncbi:GNAT family N-acetyltransferase [Aeromonas lusitana]|uniref:GNAT family N-acetyltransferase n=1 Tax=Aeromonas lusitana TaxID=931529 RepID=A0A2M8H657_9GAMM|nr:GNAT family N-acetyltransferase [Aeromonas lusitana]PJC92053.1 GNAT family N-acetyltransferase [Aeromonas lusitana]
MQIVIDPLDGPEIAAFLQAHLDDMRAVSPPESKHALDLEGLKAPAITFWSAYDEQTLVGCGAIKELDADGGEIKSMRVHGTARGKGVGSAILRHLIAIARGRGYRYLKLETGSMAFFTPAHGLYQKHGFRECAPFGDYQADPNSLFMELTIDQ